MRRIFIGSSKEQQHYAEGLATALTDADFLPEGWWQLAPAEYTLTRLVELSNLCDGAVFIFAADDVTISRKSLQATTRANVVMEFGLFVGKLGISKAIIVCEDGVDLPTNVNGIIYAQKHGTYDTIVTHFTKLRDAPDAKDRLSLQTFINRQCGVATLDGPPGNWVSRNLYVGEGAARIWKAVEEDDDYPGRFGFNELTAAITRMIRTLDTSINTIISLGPGVGDLDKQIVPSFEGWDLTSYIPVDINLQLLCAAATQISTTNAKLGIPFAILGDFEDHLTEIGRIVKEQTDAGRLYMMLGGTFVNLEKNESVFLNGMRQNLHAADLFLLDVFVKGDSYDDDREPARAIGDFPDSVRDFLSYGYVKKHGGDVTEVARHLANYVEIGEGCSRCDIDDTANFSFAVKETSKPLIYVRRYSEPAFQAFLKARGYEIVEQTTVPISDSCVDRAIYILRSGSS